MTDHHFPGPPSCTECESTMVFEPQVFIFVCKTCGALMSYTVAASMVMPPPKGPTPDERLRAPGRASAA